MGPRYQSVGSPETPLSPEFVPEKEKPYGYTECSVENDDARQQQARAMDKRIKRRIRRLRVIQRAGNLIASIMVLGIILNTYITFRTHEGIYPAEPLLWPTYLMLTTSIVSLVFNFSVLVSYYCGVSTANRVGNYANYWSYLVSIVNAIVWLVSSTAFKMSQGDPAGSPNDLWGWSCSDLAEQLQKEINNAVNFDLQCTTQLVGFIMGLITAGLEILSIFINLFALRRYLNKKRSKLIKELNKNSSDGKGPE